MFSSDLTLASVVPRRVETVEAVRAAIALDGAAVFGGLHTEEDAIAFASKLLGEKCIRVGRQFERVPRVRMPKQLSSTPNRWTNAAGSARSASPASG